MVKTDFNEELLGRPTDEVPTREPDGACNGIKTDEDKNFAGYCGQPEGWDTPNSEGRCRHHGGLSTGPKTEEGKKKAAGNAQKHALSVDPKEYAERLDDEDSDFVQNARAAILDRIRANKGEVDFLDRILANRMAIHLHIACTASDHFRQEGLFERIFTADGQIEVKNRVLEDLRMFDKDLVSNLKAIGAVSDSADDDTVDALVAWREQMQG